MNDDMRDMMHDAMQEAADDLNVATASPLWAEAVTMLRHELATVAPSIRAAIRDASPVYGWVAPYHMGWGMSIRNLLRNRGFGEKAFGIHNLDNIYAELVEEAVQE